MQISLKDVDMKHGYKKSMGYAAPKGNVTKAAEGVKTPYKGYVGQAKAYRITGKVVGQK